MPSLTSILAVLATLGVLWYLNGLRRPQSTLPLPPGPPRLPLIGNLHQAPTESPWRTYAAWAKTYGPIYSLKFGGDTVIMLSSHATARDLLDKRSNIYSSRPHLVMGSDCLSKGNRSVLMPYGPKYRTHRRLQGAFLTPHKSAQYTRLQDLESRQLIFELLTIGQDDWMDRFHRYASSLVFCLAFGKRLPRGNEDEIREIGQVMENLLYSARVGTWIVDAIPILNNLPPLLAPWKRLADRYHAAESSLFLRILKNALESENWNFAKDISKMKEAQGMPRKELSYLVGIIYEAASDTTTQALQSFVLAAVAWPDEYIKAQEEVDKILSDDEFPNFEHRTLLPYVEAVVKEVLRWRPVSAGGIPHAVTEDDEYMGYRIPRGATVVGNHWAIDRDVTVYGPDVEDFRPSRWIQDPDLPLASFGYGRRVCTGQHIAMNSLFIVVARLLWTFDIHNATDSHGNRIEVDSLAYTQGFNSGPMPFPARFVPRSESRKIAAEQAWRGEEKNVQAVMDGIERATGKNA